MLNTDGAWRGTRPPREWQRAALPVVAAALAAGEAGPLVHAVMGAGKSAAWEPVIPIPKIPRAVRGALEGEP